MSSNRQPVVTNNNNNNSNNNNNNSNVLESMEGVQQFDSLDAARVIVNQGIRMDNNFLVVIIDRRLTFVTEIQSSDVNVERAEVVNA